MILFQVINPLTKYALLMNPLARSLEELLPDRISSTYWCFILLRTALVISTVCAAFLIPFFGKSYTSSLKYIHYVGSRKLIQNKYWIYYFYLHHIIWLYNKYKNHIKSQIKGNIQCA